MLWNIGLECGDHVYRGSICFFRWINLKDVIGDRKNSVCLHLYGQVSTMPRKKMYLPYSICIRNAYVLNEFLTADRSCKTKYFWKTLIEVCSPHLYCSFGTFCAQIGQLFLAQWVFEVCLKINKSLSSHTDSDWPIASRNSKIILNNGI